VNPFDDRVILAQIGELFFGSGWRSPLARVLGVTPRMVGHWVNGADRITPERRRQIAGYFHGRLQYRLDELEAQIGVAKTLVTVLRG
jgi:hypothetical protein